MKKAFLFLPLLAALLWAGAAQAAAPTEALKGTVDKVIAILRDPALQGEGNREAQIAKLRTVFLGFFDMEELAKRTLAVHWKKFSPEERQEFESLFAKLLENTYADRIREYTDEQVLYLDEKLQDGKALVSTKIIHKGREIPMDYAMLESNGKWRVFDVNIEGVSLTRNYRTQFHEILVKDPPEQLLVRLRERTKDPAAK